MEKYVFSFTINHGYPSSKSQLSNVQQMAQAITLKIGDTCRKASSQVAESCLLCSISHNTALFKSRREMDLWGFENIKKKKESCI